MPDARARIIDANANRAREALRVMEDLARFALNNAALAADLKSIRHDLRAALDAITPDAGLFLASRDTPGDVGTSITADDERQRSNVADIAAASCKRLTEALRSLEECAKLPAPSAADADPAPAATIKALRYRAYDAEKRLRLALGTGRARQWQLCVLITESLCTHHPWHEVAAQALDGGADCLQLREKSLPDRELLARASRLVAIARDRAPPGEPPASVIINDRPDIALLARADGVHLGQDDLSVADARRIAGFSLLIGVSTGSIEQARTAAAAGADDCGVGPMFATTTKEKPTLAGPAYLAEYLADPQTARIPHLAIGGINPTNIHQLTALGCRGVAVSSAICAAQRPAVACRALRYGFAPTH